MFEIIDDNGTIHSGSEEEMIKAFECMTLSVAEIASINETNTSNAEFLIQQWKSEWKGDLKLIEIKKIYR